MGSDGREGPQDPEQDERPDEPPVDGPSAAEGNDEPGGTSFDEPGGDEHGT